MWCPAIEVRYSRWMVGPMHPAYCKCNSSYFTSLLSSFVLYETSCGERDLQYVIISVPRFTTNAEILLPLISKVRYLVGGFMGLCFHCYQSIIHFLL